MPVDIRIRFGRAIRRLREEQEINQEEAAERCGLHKTYYSGIERDAGRLFGENRAGGEGLENESAGVV
jgi:transcriptional regulator with XRE-family HTH domain